MRGGRERERKSQKEENLKRVKGNEGKRKVKEEIVEK